MEDKKNAFEVLSAINAGEHIEKFEGFSYLTWSWAWDLIKRKYPDASYTIWKDEKGLPYVYDELTGFMVYTSVTIEGITHEMWLPVLDGKNKAMKATAYEYEGTAWQNGKKVSVMKTVQPATMFDINKSIMRCLVKNLAMFGLGLYIYAGEDLPCTEEAETKPTKVSEEKPKASKPKAEAKKNDTTDYVKEAQLRALVIGYINRHQMSEEDIKRLCKFYKVASVQEFTAEHCNHYIAFLEKNGGNINE